MTIHRRSGIINSARLGSGGPLQEVWLWQRILSISYLLDFYGQMLTDKQREVTEFYYNDDLSLAEIADPLPHHPAGGVRDSIKRAEAQLRE